MLLDTSCELFPRSYFVMEFIDGACDVTSVPHALGRMADLLAAVHRVPLEALPLLPEREDPVAGLMHWLPAEYEALRASLRLGVRQPQTRRTLLHGDYWPGNLLWHGGEVVGLLDWEDAALGDPLSDVACCRLELRYKHGPDAAKRFTEHYASRAVMDERELPLWDAYVAAAALVHMSQWGLEGALEAHMRSEAQAALCTAADQLLQRRA
jgi:aminoglycoside phosphotransferase (APT) family kinase protein